MKETIALILAAGKGTRMKSKLPKVLHKVGGLPMVEQVRRTVQNAGTIRQIVVVGFGGEAVQEYLGDTAETVMQKEQLGTGHGRCCHSLATGSILSVIRLMVVSDTSNPYIF